MTGLLSFRRKVQVRYFIGDYHSVDTVGSGTIRINTNGGTVKMLKSVRYVPSLRRNLLSTGVLDNMGFYSFRRTRQDSFQEEQLPFPTRITE